LGPEAVPVFKALHVIATAVPTAAIVFQTSSLSAKWKP